MSGFRGVMLSAAGGLGAVVTSLGAGNVIGDGLAAGGPSSGTVQFNSDGTILLTASFAGAATGPANWYAPPVSGVGSSYWVRWTLTAGTFTTGTAGVWLSLATGASVGKSLGSGTGAASATFTVQIASDAAGATILSTSTGWVVGYQHTI